MNHELLLRAVGITKSFGAVHALRRVDFEVRAGMVTALFGENGAGKSTLMKILAGVQGPTTGHLEVDGEPVVLRSTADAAERGIAIIHQELSLCPNLSVRDNIFLGRERRRGGVFIDYRNQDAATSELLARLEQRLPAKALVGDLRLGQQQIVEIARALAGRARILVMDEPTSALSAHEVEVLFGVIRELTASGVAVVYVSHHLEEALEIADHAVVLRDGALVAHSPADTVDIRWVIANMIGRQASDLELDLSARRGERVLSLRDVSVADPTNPSRLAVSGCSLDVAAGEIVCLYGLMGAGRTELLEALAGRLRTQDGTVELAGHALTNETIAERIALGLALTPEDRQRDGLVQTLSVGNNLSLAGLRAFVRRGFTSARAERAAVDESIRDVRIKTTSQLAPISSLSGGNQQKVVIGKVLMTSPRALLLDEPTRGIDVGAKSEIFALMVRQAERGLAVLFSTSEINEALTMAHRIIVLRRGRIVAEFDPAVADKDDVMIASGEARADANPIGTSVSPGN